MGETIEMFFVGILFIVFAPFVAITSFFSIFFPAKFSFKEEHLKNCWLKHDTFRDRLYHFLDTRGCILSFDGNGSNPFKNSPNRLEWLNHEKSFLEEQVISDRGYLKGYKEYCEKELNKVNEEINILKK